MVTKTKTLRFIFLFLCFSFLLLSVASVPRRLIKLDPSAPILLSQGGVEGVKEGRKLEGRMEIELTDYPGVGANTNHDPRSPGN